MTALDVDRLLDALDLADLARQAGAKLTGRGNTTCPLHGGDNPAAFHVWSADDGRQLYTCFTHCGTGDALAFIQKWKTLDFIEAVKWGADLAHLPLSELGLTAEAAKEHAERERRRDVLDLAARFYQRQLLHSGRRRSPAIAYALSRGFNLGTLRRLGFSDGGRGLQDYLQAHHADLALAREIKLLRSDGLDFTANADGQKASPSGWLIYIHRNGARVDYLSARALDPTDPKDKSRNLPGKKQIYRAEVASDRRVLVIEGQADGETLRQLGLSAWALCGTSLSESDAAAAGRREKGVYLALDDDTHQAGTDEQQDEREERTAQRRRDLADRLGPLTMICPPLPAGIKDHNAWLQQVPELSGKTVNAWMKRAQPWVQIRLEEAALAGPIEQTELVAEVAHLLARLPPGVQPRWYRLAKEKLGMTKAELHSANGRTPGGEFVAASIKAGCLAMYGVPLITCTAYITKQQEVNDGFGPPLVRYTIVGALASGQPLRELQVAASDFESLGWLTEWGARVIKLVHRGQHWEIARAIQELSVQKGGQMTEEHVYAHTGWATINGERSFLTAAGRLTATGLDTSTQIDLGDSNMRQALPAPPAGAALKTAVRASLDYLTAGPLRVQAPLWAAMYAAPLTSVRSLDCMLWVYGPGGCGKSSDAHTALAHFGTSYASPRKYYPQIGWNSTSFAIETAMFICKDVPLIVDDYAPQVMSLSDRDKVRKTANEAIRSLGNRMARGRGEWSKSGGKVKRAANARGLVIATAENPIEGQSLVNRMLYVPVEKGEIIKSGNNPVFDKAQEHAAEGLYAQAMSAYIAWLIVNWDEAVAEFTRLADAAAQQARAALPSGNDRIPDYFGTLDAAQRLALRAFVDLKALPEALAAGYADDFGAGILEVVTNQVGRVAEQSPAKMFLQAAASLLDRQKCYLAPRKTMDKFFPPPQSERIGWFDPSDKGAVWLEPQDALNQVSDYWKGTVVFDTPRDAMKHLMKQAGVLRDIDVTGNPEVSKWMGASGTLRCLEIDLQKVLDLWGIDLRFPRTLHNIRPPDEDDDPPPAPLPLDF